MRASDIGTIHTRQEFADYLNSIRPGQYFSLKGYVDAQGERSNRILRFGIDYRNLKKMDVGFLRSVVAGGKHFVVEVEHGVWIPNELLEDLFSHEGNPVDVRLSREVPLVGAELVGRAITMVVEGPMDLMDVEKFGNRKSKDRTPCMLRYRLPSTHPLVLAAIGDDDLQGTLLHSLANPKAKTNNYVKEAQACYSTGVEGEVEWHLRDVLHEYKTVLESPRNVQFSASLPLVAIKNAIALAFLRTGRYRDFVLEEDRFESIVVDGLAILPGDHGSLYFVDPDDLKKTLATEKQEKQATQATQATQEASWLR